MPTAGTKARAGRKSAKAGNAAPQATPRHTAATAANGGQRLRLEWIEAGSLAENPHNWRRHPEGQMAALKDVIADPEIGWAGACLYNELTSRLIDGHARRKSVDPKTLIPVLVGSWSEAAEKKILLTLDPLAGMAEADPEKLRALLDECSLDTDALKALGDGLAEQLKQAERDNQPEVVEDEAPLPAQGPPVAARGDLWLLGEHRLMCGDSTDAGDVALLMDGAKPFLMVTDPPYGVEYDADWRNDALGGKAGGRATGKVSNDDKADWSEAWALFPGEVAYIWHAGNMAHVVADSLLKAGLEIRAQIIWAKSQFVIGRGHYHPHHEPCWYAVRKGGKGHWSGDRKQSTLWQIDKPRKSETGHSTQKPVECMARPIRNHGGKDDDVYDPFLGSGTTLIAAEQLGRKCYGMEISPQYCDVIIKRWEKLTGKKADRI